MTTQSAGAQAETLDRIEKALLASRQVFSRFTTGAIRTEYKVGRDPVTAADTEVDALLRRALLREDEGWLSEESPDDLVRLEKDRVWVVDPLDGTQEFVDGVPEFCVSVAMVEKCRPVAGGIYNPATDEMFLGSTRTGVTYNGRTAQASLRPGLDGAVVLASRSEFRRGDWKIFSNAPFEIRPKGSVAYKLALVAAGLADATLTLFPKNEWDVAAGIALVESAGGVVRDLSGMRLGCNQRKPMFSSLIASGPKLHAELMEFVRSKRSK